MSALVFPELRKREVRRTASDRVLASIDRHYRRCQRRGVLPLWIRARKTQVLLKTLARQSETHGRLALKAVQRAAQYRQEVLRNPQADRRTLLKLARYWRTA